MSVAKKLEAELIDLGKLPKTKKTKTKAEHTPTGDSVFDLANACPIADVMAWLGQVEADGQPICPGCRESDQGVAYVKNGLKCSHDRCKDRGVKKGFRTPVDVVMEVRSLEPIDAAYAICERFGVEVPKREQAANETSSDAQEWSAGLICDAKGKPKKGLANVMHVLSRHPAWQGVLAYDAFAATVVRRKAPPMRASDKPASYEEIGDWTETDSTRTAAWLHHVTGVEAGAETVTQAIVAIAERVTIHPVRDWLRSLKWDGVARLDSVLSAYFGADNTPYTRTTGPKWMISAVARIMDPGCQVDHMLVLEGQQGTGKSTGLEALAGKPWFADTPLDLGGKDAYQSLRRKWIYEIGELESFRGRDATKIKAFVSARSDNYRPSYGRRNQDVGRQVVFAGTTNEDQYLTDRTGNRRFWPVRCTGNVDVEGLRRDRAQLWAEAVQRYSDGEIWHVDSAEIRKLCEDEQADRQAPDDWIPIVERWLGTPAGQKQINDGLTTADVLLGAIGMQAKDLNRTVSTRAGFVLRDLGFKPDPNPVRRDGDRVRLYRRLTQPT